MTTQTQTTLRFHVSEHGWKDAFVVSFLAIVLGAFVAQISSTPRNAPGSQPMASVSAAAAVNG
ncbi:MAG: hypothetical protein WCS72_04405 [Deltaproteobacteria bacterium]